MNSTKSLPNTYKLCGTCYLSHPKIAVGLNMVATLLLAFWGMVFLKIAAGLRPEVNEVQVRINPLSILLFVALSIFSIVLHELVHGLFLGVFTRERPRFGFTGLWAYASSPGWYIPRNQYLVIALAPFVLITLGGVGLLWLLPFSAVLPVVLVMALNAAGASGDLLLTGWILTCAKVKFVSETNTLDVTLYEEVDK